MALGRAGDKLLITSDAYLHIVGDTRGYLAIRGVCFFLLRLGVAAFVELDNISLTERLNASIYKIFSLSRSWVAISIFKIFSNIGQHISIEFHTKLITYLYII